MTSSHHALTPLSRAETLRVGSLAPSPRLSLREGDASSALVGLAFIALVLTAAPAQAHDRTTSYSTWELDGRKATVTARFSLLDASRFPWFFSDSAEGEMKKYLADRLRLFAGDEPCAVASEPRKLESAPDRLVYEWKLACPDAGERSIRSDLLLDVSPAHLHFARLLQAGQEPQERLLSDAERTWPFDAAGAAADVSLGGYFHLGVDHILTGWDHLAFLLALLLLEASAWDVAKVVTGFTIGHSITLALALVGVVRPDMPAIEALIGLSIALVAAEDLWLLGGRPRFLRWALAALLLALAGVALGGWIGVPALTLAGLALFVLCYFALLDRSERPTRVRWAVAFLFGLLHGFGFAGILLEARLPPQRLVQALCGFNLGVEAGQLAIVLLAWPLVAWMGRRPAGRLAIEIASAAMLMLGTFWFVTRAFG